MTQVRVNCSGCGFTEVYDGEVPPEDVSAEEWDAETAAAEARDNHQVREGHSVHIERIE